MLTLLSHGGSGEFYSYSMFCTKAACLLQLSGQPWQRQDMFDPQEMAAMPFGKLPVLQDEQGALTPDSEGIRGWLEARGVDFDPGLDARQKAQSRLVIRMLDEALWVQVLCARWLEQDGWEAMLSSVFAGVPEAALTDFRAGVLAGLHFVGHGRFARDERLRRLDQDLTALDGVLGDKPYLFGAAMTAADCSAMPMLEAVSRAPASPSVVAVAQKYPRLLAYVDRVRTTVALTLPQVA